MKGTCVFRCQFKGQTYRVLEQERPHFHGEKIYWTYIGRRKLDATHWDRFEGAIASIMLRYDSSFIYNLLRAWV